MTNGEINPPTVQIAMPKEMAFDRIGVGNNSAALLWSKIVPARASLFTILFYQNLNQFLSSKSSNK